MKGKTSCVCSTCNCGLHNCPTFPMWPSTKDEPTPIPFGKQWKMNGVSIVTTDFTSKPIYPHVPPRPSSRRWISDKETTHHDHFRPLPIAPLSPCPPLHPPKCGGYKNTRSTYKSDYKKNPPCPMSQISDLTLGQGGHTFWT